MNIRLITVTAAALAATLAASADAASPTRASAESAQRADRTLHAEIVASMRELLSAVTPSISLPTVKIELPSLDSSTR